MDLLALTRLCGVYQLRIGPIHYVGQSTHVLQRILQHQAQLKAGTHTNEYLQEAYRQYPGDFQADLLQECPSPHLLAREYEWFMIQKQQGKRMANRRMALTQSLRRLLAILDVPLIVS